MFFIYGALNSKACDKAEFILHTLGYHYRMYHLGIDYTLAQLERLIPEVKTVPQIYHGTKYIGGVRELYEFLQASESLGGGELSRLNGVEKLFNESPKNKSDSSGIHKDQ
jgi:glutaredoxin